MVIVGGGAAGFFAAIACAEKLGAAGTVTLFEATAHPLAKVRVSGGGRCNLTHACFEPRDLVRHYPRGGRELLGAFHRWQPRDTVAWFAARGVETKTEDDGRMFPVTDDSATIAECLLQAAAAAGVVVVTSRGVRKVEALGRAGAAPDFWLTLTDDSTVRCDRLLIATGGNKASAGLTIAAALGHTIIPPVPSLFTFHIDDRRLEGLSGLAVEHDSLYVVPALDDAPGRDFHRWLSPVLTRHGCDATGRGAPYVTDASHYAAAGAPTVVLGPGDLAQAHTKDEWVALDQLRTASAVYLDAMRAAG